MKILANDGLSQKGVKMLTQAGIEVLEHRVAQEQLSHFINDNQIDGLLVRSTTKVPKELIDACPSLRLIGRGGVGTDNIDVAYAESKGIKVINTPAASAQSVAELVFAHFFTLARFLHEANRMMPLEGETKFKALKKSYAQAVELSGKTLGIIGFGRIGKEVAKIGIALGMKPLVVTRTARKENLSWSFFDGSTVHFEIETTTDLHEVLSQSDFLTINTPKTEHYLIDTPEYEAMKSGIFIVNAARGGVLNEQALLDFIESGKIAGAALDVFETEPEPSLAVLMNPALSLSPHLGGSTVEAQDRIGTELAQQIIKLRS
ncbi:D-2-hydroxyacid dehydrogenase [Riemerella columbina]|uniref:D-2-hydroxyacid dehydrogenase n=1 Tax=Riemerella columbina TaxID=103810 RepID=UPI00266F0DB4|nr:D-2-hydroxyacid dehydrogenase [Riemerella columbina]WKS94617.1 D-2-hydroxyacid dehydrogenase [Riemerella columbina]